MKKSILVAAIAVIGSSALFAPGAQAWGHDEWAALSTVIQCQWVMVTEAVM